MVVGVVTQLVTRRLRADRLLAKSMQNIQHCLWPGLPLFAGPLKAKSGLVGVSRWCQPLGLADLPLFGASTGITQVAARPTRVPRCHRSLPLAVGHSCPLREGVTDPCPPTVGSGGRTPAISPRMPARLNYRHTAVAI